ncbi:glycosyltransferase family 2 protein [Aquimarina rubra]|uniref:Glycosyltransferase family 2 protein n=1 Tax=Aquimarina rubra TaxID=1920033 RepID=A0ABW5LKB5_9FLAO
MHNSKLVSVICLCYNHERYIEECLDSVINQTHSNIEIIIVDDFSSDNSARVIHNWIKKNPNVIFIENKQNLGNTYSFNQALKKAKGTYIIDLATDDVLLPNFIETHLNNFYIKKTSNPGISFCNVELIDEDSNHIGYHFEINTKREAIKKPKEGDLFASLLDSYYINPVGMMTKKAVMDQLCGYDESLAYEDFDFWIRSSRNFDYIYLDSVAIKKRVLKNSLSSSFKYGGKQQRNMDYSTYLVCKKAFNLVKTDVEKKALSNRIIHELKLVTKNFNFPLSFKYCFLYFKTKFLKFTSVSI